MVDPATALTAAIENSTKVANTPLFSTVIDRLLGFKISEWKAQGDTVKKQILDGYEEAKQKGLGIQYVSAFRASANLINVGVKAAQYIDTRKQSNIEMDNDVFWGLLEHSKGISNEQMQELIAKIIAGEYNAPGTYSVSTLQIIKMLGRNDLELFEKVAGLLINKIQLPAHLFTGEGAAKDFMNKLELDFGKLQTLQILGLILPNSMSSNMTNAEKDELWVSYFDRTLTFISENDNYREVKLPNFYELSPAGEQIVKHLNPKYMEEYYRWLQENYKISNYKYSG